MIKDLKTEAAKLRASFDTNNGSQTQGDKESSADALPDDTNESTSFEAENKSDVPQGEETEPLPEPLVVLQFKQRGLAVVIAVAAVIGAVVTRQFQPLALMLASLYFLWKAWFINFDWTRGRIEQRVVICTQAITRTKTTQITCRDQYNIYSYVIPDKKCDICEGYTYIIWSHVNTPRNIMAYQPI